MKTQIVIKSLAAAIFTITMGASAQTLAAGSDVQAKIRQGVKEVIDLRLNLAAGLIKALDSNLVCDVDAYPSSINDQVTTAWSQATEQQKRAFLKKIPAKSIIRKDLAFRIAVDYVDLARNAQLEKFKQAIIGTQYFTFGRGVFGSHYNVTLGRDGVAREKTMEVLPEKPWTRWHSSKTTWTVELNKSENGERFLIKIGNKTYNIDRGQTGEVRLVPPGVKKETSEYFEQVLSSADSYCEA